MRNVFLGLVFWGEEEKETILLDRIKKIFKTSSWRFRQILYTIGRQATRFDHGSGCFSHFFLLFWLDGTINRLGITNENDRDLTSLLSEETVME